MHRSSSTDQRRWFLSVGIAACLAICSGLWAQVQIRPLKAPGAAPTTRPETQPATTRPAATRPIGDFKLRGRVVDDAGKPIKGADVRNWQNDAKADTDEDGRFVFNDIPVVKSSLWISQAGFQGESREYVMPPDGRLAELVITLKRTGGISGIVVGADGKTPIVEAAVSAHMSLQAGEETDEEGRFTLKDLNSGTVTLLAWSDEFTVHRQVVEVVSGQITPDVKITLSKRGGTLSGTVIDADVGGEPLGGEFLLAFPLDLNDRAPDRWELEHQTAKNILSGSSSLSSRIYFHATTNEKGEFKFERLPESRYLVYLLPHRGPMIRRENIQVKDGQAAGPLTIELSKRPAGYITGTILTPAGEPLASADIHVEHRTEHSGGSSSSSSTRKTDSDGRYYEMIESVGKHTVALEIKGFARISKSLTVDRTDAVPPELDFNLEPQKTVAATQPGPSKASGSIAGMVFLSDGKTPAADVPVKPFTRNRQFPGGANSMSYVNGERYEVKDVGVKTASDGSFVIEELPAGSYGVLADTRMESRFNSAGISPELALTLPTPSPEVDVKDNQRTGGVRIVMNLGCTVTGVVRDAETNQPIAKAGISLNEQRSSGFSLFSRRPKEASFAPSSPDPTAADQEGHFWVWGLKPGSYIASIYAEGYDSANLESFDLKAGEQKTLADVKLKAQPVYAGPATGSLAGHVFMPDGKNPAAGVMVGPAAPARFPGCENRWNREKQTWFTRMSDHLTTGQDGAFVLDTLPAGKYCVYAQPHPEPRRFLDDGQPPKVYIPELAHTRAAWSGILEVKAGQKTDDARIVLAPAGALAGKIIDADTGQPLVARIWIMPAGFHQENPDEAPDPRSMSFSTEKDGSFQMPGLLPGKYNMNFSAMGRYEPANKTGQVVKAGETLTFDLKLKPRH